MSERLMIPDERFTPLGGFNRRVAEANVEMYDRLSLHDYPLIIFAVCCRNGMQHAFSRMMSRIGSGEYSNPPLSVRRVQRYAAAERFIGAP